MTVIPRGSHRPRIAVQVGRYARLVDQDHGPGALCQVRFHALRSQVLGHRVDIGKHWRGADVARGVGCRDERQRRHDYLVAGADPGHDQGQMERGGARRDGYRVPRAVAAANLASNSATRGPCATQPEATTAAAASASSGPSHGRMTGIIAAPATRRRAGADPRRDQLRASSRAASAAAETSAIRRVTAFTLRAGPNSNGELRLHHTK